MSGTPWRRPRRSCSAPPTRCGWSSVLFSERSPTTRSPCSRTPPRARSYSFPCLLSPCWRWACGRIRSSTCCTHRWITCCSRCRCRSCNIVCRKGAKDAKKNHEKVFIVLFSYYFLCALCVSAARIIMSFVTPNLMPAMPEIFVFSMACAILVIDLFLSDRLCVISYWLTQATLVRAALLTVKFASEAPMLTFSRMFVADSLADLLKLGTYVITFFVFAYSRDYLRDRGMFRGEYFVLGLFGVVGMMVMASASHFLPLYLGLELLSLSLYAMIAFQRDSGTATEAAMKYFVLGAIASGMLLYGMSMLYGATGSLEIAAVSKAISKMSPDNIILIFGLVFVIAGSASRAGGGR